MSALSGVRVLIVGESDAFRAAMIDRLERDGVRGFAQAADSIAACRIASAECPDVCLVGDVAPFDGVATAAVVCDAAPDVRVMLMGPTPSDARLLEAVAAGASGYVSCAAESPQFTGALLDAVAGRSAFPRRLEALLIASMQQRV